MDNLKTPEKKAKLSRRCKISKKIILNVFVVLCMCTICSVQAFAAISTAAFITNACKALKAIVQLIGAGFGVWGVVNLVEGYGNDNPGSKSQGIKQLMAGIGLIVVGALVVPQLQTMMTAAQS